MTPARWVLSPVGPFAVDPLAPHELEVTADAAALLRENGWTPPADWPSA